MSSKSRSTITTGFAAALLAAASTLFPVLARAQESAPQLPPADGTAMVGFLVVFVGMIVGYILWIMRQQKKQKKSGEGEVR